MNDGLRKLNEAGRETAESVFRDCCGSRRWAELVAGSRPFTSEEDLLQKATAIWNDLNESDWLEAFGAHPKIGESKAASHQQKRSAGWSKGEQAGVSTATDETRDELVEVNRLYEQKFGFIFIVCATGKGADEMLQLCRQRLGNTPADEFRIAAEEQRKITEIRLRKLLDQ